MITLTFGDESLPVTQSYPMFEDMEELQKYETLKVAEVELYEEEYGNWLHSIHLKFEGDYD